MNAITKKAIKDVTRRKLRAALTILGIGIGVLGLTAITITSNQLNASFGYSLNSAAQPDIQFATTPAPAGIATLLGQQPNVKQVQASSFEVARWTIPAGHFPLALVGIANFQDVQINPFQLTTGHVPGAGEVLMESSDRGVEPFHLGDTITIVIRNQPVQLKISGFTRTQGLPSATFEGLAFGYLSESSLESLYQITGPNGFLIQVQDQSQLQATARELTGVLESRQVKVLSATIGHSNDGLSQIVNGLLEILGLLAIIALALSVFLLLSTITTLVAEQIPTIGTMKAIGARRRQVMRGYLTSILIYGVIGTAIGLALGIVTAVLLITYISGLLTLDTGTLAIGAGTILLGVAVGVGVPLLAAIVPVYLGTRITVHQALSGYGLETTTRRRIGRARRSISILPQTVQLGMRSLSRKRIRTVLTLMALAISGACFLAVQTTAYSFSNFLVQETSIYNADVFIALASPTPLPAVEQELSGIAGIAELDGIAQEQVHSQWGSGILTGVTPGSPVYHQQMISGRWFTADDTNVVVLSDKAASRAGRGVGQTISLNDGLHSATWKIIGIASDNNNASSQFGVVLAPLAEVNAFRHLPSGYVDEALIISSSHQDSTVNELSRQVDSSLSSAGIQALVQTKAELDAQNQNTFLVLEVLLYIVAVIIAVVGAIGLFNALAMSVLERRREIGILRSMGARGWQVAEVFWTEGLSLGAISWLIAVMVGIPAAYGFVLLLGRVLATLPFALDPVSLIWMLVFILVVATVASIGPVVGAARLSIAETLKYE
jgi:putative ABC transport system permease protein